MAFPSLRQAFPRLARPGTQIRGYSQHHPSAYNYAEEPYFLKDVRFFWRGVFYLAYPYMFSWFFIDTKESGESYTETEAGSRKSK